MASVCCDSSTFQNQILPMWLWPDPSLNSSSDIQSFSHLLRFLVPGCWCSSRRGEGPAMICSTVTKRLKFMWGLTAPWLLHAKRNRNYAYFGCVVQTNIAGINTNGVVFVLTESKLYYLLVPFVNSAVCCTVLRGLEARGDKWFSLMWV